MSDDERKLKERITELEAKVAELEAVCCGYEQWEADVIMGDCWRHYDGLDSEFPNLTAELWDKLGELQTMRNKALGRFANKAAE